jgi:hypothetical protein
VPIKNELQKLKQIDIWSLMLFVLYNFQKVPEYSALSELAYILDEKNLLKLCEYFGGQTLYIPTIDQLEETIYGMLLYQYIDIEKIPEKDALLLLRADKSKETAIKNCYRSLKYVLNNYELTPRGSI